MATLKVEDVTLTFGGLNALFEVSLDVQPGLITSIIGPNGAGKTSLLNCISGFYHPTSGDVYYGDHKLNRASPHQVSIMGIARAFQNIELFSGMTVLDNLMLARHKDLRYSLWNAVVYFGKASREESLNRQYVEEVIDFMELEAYRNRTVGSLSYGIQKRVEVARALTLAPELLLLDEPSLGLAPILVDEIFKVILTIREEGVTILLVEQNAKKALELADKGYVFETGRIVFEGSAEKLMNSAEVKQAYLGG